VLFAVAAVLTVVEELRNAGYYVGIAGFLAMLFLRYWFRRHLGQAPVERQA
jgi:hypothetical protein